VQGSAYILVETTIWSRSTSSSLKTRPISISDCPLAYTSALYNHAQKRASGSARRKRQDGDEEEGKGEEEEGPTKEVDAVVKGLLDEILDGVTLDGASDCEPSAVRKAGEKGEEGGAEVSPVEAEEARPASPRQNVWALTRKPSSPWARGSCKPCPTSTRLLAR